MILSFRIRKPSKNQKNNIKQKKPTQSIKIYPQKNKPKKNINYNSTHTSNINPNIKMMINCIKIFPQLFHNQINSAPSNIIGNWDLIFDNVIVEVVIWGYWVWLVRVVSEFGVVKG